MIDLITMYNYDNTIFDNLQLPSTMNKDDFVNNLLLETAELELMYSKPNFLKFAIGVWSKKELDIWEKLEATLHYDYDPISNTNRTETETITEEKTGKRNVDGSSTDAGTANTTTTNNYKRNENATDSRSVSSYESDTLKTAEQNTNTINTDNTDTSTNESNSSGTSTLKQTENSEDTGTVTRELQTHGSIGVMTTQSLIEEERRVVQFCIDDYIIASFKKKFCILVY